MPAGWIFPPLLAPPRDRPTGGIFPPVVRIYPKANRKDSPSSTGPSPEAHRRDLTSGGPSRRADRKEGFRAELISHAKIRFETRPLVIRIRGFTFSIVSVSYIRPPKVLLNAGHIMRDTLCGDPICGDPICGGHGGWLYGSLGCKVHGKWEGPQRDGRTALQSSQPTEGSSGQR